MCGYVDEKSKVGVKMDNFDYDRFTMKQDDVNFINNNGEIIEDVKEYFKNRKNEMLTISDNLKIGDVVKLKFTEDIVIIDKIDYAGFKYAGYILGESELTLFNQESIEEIIDKPINDKGNRL